MADANIARRSGGSASTSGNKSGNAILRISTKNGNPVKVSDGTVEYNKVCDSSGIIEIYVKYGTWTIEVTNPTIGSKLSKTVEVNELKIYNLNIAPPDGHTYGIKIDTTNGDPAGAVIYTDDAVGFTPLSVNQSTGVCNYGSWNATSFMKNFLGCRPCLYKDGEVVGYLNPNDYSKFEDGTTADITSGDAGDVMIEFKKCWYKFSKVGTDIFFQISDYDRSADGFVTTAFRSMNSGEDVDKIYYGAYEGYSAGTVSDGAISGGKWRSISNKICTGSIYFTNTRTYCKTMGNKYGMEDYSKRWYILGLLMLVTKGRNMQATVGQGRWQQDSPIQTGTMNAKGLFYGKSVYIEGVKCFGIENMWGNYWNFIDGIISISNTTLGLKNTAPYTNSKDDFTSITNDIVRNSWINAITDMIPVLDGATMIAITGISDKTKGWADGWYLDSSSSHICIVGGNYACNTSYAAYLGPFAFNIRYSHTYGFNGCVGRIVAA